MSDIIEAIAHGEAWARDYICWHCDNQWIEARPYDDTTSPAPRCPDCGAVPNGPALTRFERAVGMMWTAIRNELHESELAAEAAIRAAIETIEPVERQTKLNAALDEIMEGLAYEDKEATE